jgi:hypothetical protein
MFVNRLAANLYNSLNLIIGLFLISSILLHGFFNDDLQGIITENSNLVSDDNTNTSLTSPSFRNQEILDPKLDWMNLKSRQFVSDGDRATDIESVDYYSDGKTLNSILWLFFPFKPNPIAYEDVNYGMYINSDFDDDTGFGGIDYKVEISWNNNTKEWTRVLEKWSHFGEALVLENETVPYSTFSKEGGGGHYVMLSADLSEMLSPQKYKVVFYGEVRKNDGILRTDFTRMVAVPPLELTISTSPNSVELRKGEKRTIEVKFSTVQGYEPTVNLNSKAQSDNIIIDFTQNDTEAVPNYVLHIPSYGVATVPMTITASENASLGPYTLFIFANSSFPPEELIRPRLASQETINADFLPSSVRTVENIFSDSTLLLTLHEPLTIIDEISAFWSKVGSPISFMYGVIAGLVPLIFTKIRHRYKNRKS